MQKTKSIYIGVIGAGECSKDVCRLAEEVGERITKAGAVLVCGGLGGVMEAAAKGAKNKGGVTIGILPGTDKNDANPYIDFPIATGLGGGRNLLVIGNSDAVIALPGGFGTLSEIAFALKSDKPVISLFIPDLIQPEDDLFNWDVSDKIIKVKSAEEAVRIAIDKAEAL